MGYGGRDLARAYRTVRGNTIKTAEEIPESQLGFSPAPGVRTIRELLTHVAWTDAFLSVHREGRTSFDGFNFLEVVTMLRAEEQKPRTKAELLDLLRQRGESTASWLETLTDEFLGEAFAQPPGTDPATKTRFEMLMAMKEHEMHHRGQLMLIQRLLGQVPHLTRAREERMAAAAAART